MSEPSRETCRCGHSKDVHDDSGVTGVCFGGAKDLAPFPLALVVPTCLCTSYRAREEAAS